MVLTGMYLIAISTQRQKKNPISLSLKTMRLFKDNHQMLSRSSSLILTFPLPSNASLRMGCEAPALAFWSQVSMCLGVTCITELAGHQAVGLYPPLF